MVNFLGGHGHRRILAVQKMNFLHPIRSVGPSLPPALGRYTFPNVPALITTLILTGSTASFFVALLCPSSANGVIAPLSLPNPVSVTLF